ncbi:MFS transporter [Pseudonocardia sp. NPDC046786]|uniref:MFS transporter n=1 Tax=Pseudonocardia sp. NPDC046786 TaxID=3155471 RepID=UPI003403C191
MSRTDSPSKGPKQQVRRRAALAGMFGTAIENFDLSLYAYLVIFTAPTFFPTGNAATAVIASLAVFAVGFLSRPLGGIVFGRMGDRHGRRFTLLVTVVLMGVSTGALGLIPGYATIGIWAPILLVVVRLLQGFSAGGEVIGAATYVVESSTPGRRGLFASATPLGAVLGVAMAPVVVGVFTVALGSEAMAAGGWRFAFLVALPLTALCLYFRLRIEDSPEYLDLVERREVAHAPVREALQRHWRGVVAVMLLALSIFFVGYTLTAYMPVFLASTVGIAPATVNWLSAVVLLLAAPAVLLGGFSVDRYGRRAVMVAAFAVTCVVAFPAMTLMTGAGNSAFTVGLAYWVLLFSAYAAMPAAYKSFSDLFPTRIRYTAAAIGFNVGNVIGGGFGPYFTAQVTEWTGDSRSPALLLGLAAVIGIGTMLVITRKNRPGAQEHTDLVTPAT